MDMLEYLRILRIIRSLVMLCFIVTAGIGAGLGIGMLLQQRVEDPIGAGLALVLGVALFFTSLKWEDKALEQEYKIVKRYEALKEKRRRQHRSPQDQDDNPDSQE